MKRSVYTFSSLSVCILLFISVLFGCTAKTSEQSNPFPDEGSLIINEVMSSNSHYAQSKDGEFYDWAELYNSTDEDIDLEGYYFSDSGTEPLRWTFPAVTIKAHSYIIVYMSGLDKWDGAYELHTNFKLSSTGEPLILSHSSGDIIQQMEIPPVPQNVSYGLESTADEYLLFSVPSPCGKNSGGVATEDELVFPVYDVVVNEYMSENSHCFADSTGNYHDWVELYNCSLNDIDLSGFYLTDDRYDIMKWTFPSDTVIKAESYMTVFCSGLNSTAPSGEMHTSFAISDNDDRICLYTPQGILCSYLDICTLAENTSTGLSEENIQQLFSRPTPGEANSTPSYPINYVLSANFNDGIFISEAMSVSGSRSKYPNDWVEIFNSTDKDINLGGYGLSTSDDTVEFTFPDTVLKSGAYLLVYCTGTEQTASGNTLYAPFKLSNSGETLYLTNSLGQITDIFSTGKQRDGISAGRNESSPDERLFFTVTTPGKANNISVKYSSYCSAPSFDTLAGYVEGGTSVKVSVPKGTYVVITKDGSEPSADGKAYHEDFSVTINETTVLRARAFADGCLSSDIITSTYLVEAAHSIAVVSLASPPNGLFSNKSGILANGPGYTEKKPHYGANFWKDWERATHIEYISTDGVCSVEFDCGIHTFGQFARGLPQKGLALILREQYGTNEISYPFFADNGVASYKSLLLRPEGQDWNRAKLRDVLVPALLKGTHFTAVDYMDYTPVALYINGDYWGLYYLREKLNDNYLTYKYGFEKENIDLIKGQTIVQTGSKSDLNALNKFLNSNKLTSAKNYEYFCSQVDIDSFIQFWIVQTFVCNADTGNIRQYKDENGKWRWMLYDFDWAFMSEYVKRDMIYAHMYDPEGHGSGNNMSNLMARKLLENKEFKNKFVTEYIKALKYVFNYERSGKILAELQASIKSEMPRQHNRWNAPSPSFQKSQIDNVDLFLQKRSAHIKTQLKRHFDLSEKKFQQIWDSV